MTSSRARAPHRVVSIDARTVTGSYTGIGRYGRELVHALARLDAPLRYEVLATDSGAAAFHGLPEDRVQVRPGHAPIPDHPRSDLWMHCALPFWLHRHRIDVHFSIANYLPLFAGTQRVVTIHDMVPFRHPEGEPRLFTLYLKWMLRLAAMVADQVVAVSAFTGREIQEVFRFPAERIRVVSNGPSGAIRKLDGAELAARVMDSPVLRSLPRPFILTAGVHIARKNFVRLIGAHGALAARGYPHHLVIVGPEGTATAAVRDAAARSPSRERIHLLSYLSDDELCAAYNLAEIFAYPSLYEGFGIPLLEAFAAEVPVVAARSSSIPEVAGDAAVLVDPTSETALCDGLERILKEPDLRHRLVDAGRARRNVFSWDRAARETAAVLLDPAS